MERWCNGCNDWTKEAVNIENKRCLGCGKELTHSYTYFTIVSDGKMGMYGHEASVRGVFDPDEITNLLGIEPFDKLKKGDYRKNMPKDAPQAKYSFSRWSGEKSDVERHDVSEQCLATIQRLEHKIPELLEIKSRYDVEFYLKIVPHIYNAESPIIYFDKKIIAFCYLTDTEIDVDTYIYEE